MVSDQFIVLKSTGPLSPGQRKYSRRRMESLAEPNRHTGVRGKRSVLELLLDPASPIDSPVTAKPSSGSHYFRSVPRDGLPKRDESLPPGYYSPNYRVLYRSLPSPSFAKNLKPASVFSRTRPPTPVESPFKPTHRHTMSELNSPTSTVKMGFTSFAKMSSRTTLFGGMQGANEKRFDNFDLYEKDKKHAMR